VRSSITEEASKKLGEGEIGPGVEACDIDMGEVNESADTFY